MGGGRFNTEYSVFCLSRLVDRIVASGALSVHVMANLKSLCAGFGCQDLGQMHGHSQDQVQGLGSAVVLNDQQEESLEVNWFRLTRFVLDHPPAGKDHAFLQLGLFQIGHFLAARTRRRRDDVQFGMDVLSWGLGALKECLNHGLMSEADAILHAAENSSVLDSPDLAFETFQSLSSLLLVYKILVLNSKEPVDRNAISKVLETIRNPSELEPQLLESLSRVCFNIGLQLHGQGRFEDAVVWLKSSLNFGPEQNVDQEALTLLASAYLQWQGDLHWSNAIAILDITDESGTNLELRLRALLAAKKEPHVVAECAMKLFRRLTDEDESGDGVTESFARVLTLLERSQQWDAIVQVLEHVPWSVRCEPAVEEQRSVVRVKWICAAYAARLYARRRQWDDFCELLGLLSHWNAQTEDEQVVEEIVELAERTALAFRNEEGGATRTLQWYDMLVQLSTFHRVPVSVVWNAIASALSSDQERDCNKAKMYLQLVPLADEETVAQLCLRLRVALRDADVEATVRAVSRVDRSVDSLAVHWPLLARTFGLGLRPALERDRHGQLVDCLRSALQHSTHNVLKCASLLFLLRIQMTVLRNDCAGSDLEKRDSHLEAILTTLEQACDVLGGVETRRHLLIGSDSIDLWFASAAWNLGRQAVSSAWHRHRFFHFAHRFIVLAESSATAPGQGTSSDCAAWRQRTETALTCSALAALAVEGDAGRRALRASLEMTLGRDAVSSRSNLARLIEFDILCRLGEWGRASDAFDRFFVDGAASPRFDAEFFQSAAAVLLGNASAAAGPASDRMVVTCLQKVVSQNGVDSSQHVVLWRWLIRLLWNGSTSPEDLATASFQETMDRLAAFVHSLGAAYPPGELCWLVKQIWNSVLLVCRDRPTVVRKWVEYCQALIADSSEVRQQMQLELAAY